MSYAIIKDGKELKRHPTRYACVIEAVERGLATKSAGDFYGYPRDQVVVNLHPNIKIKEVEDEE